MHDLALILGGGLAMSAIAMVGGITTLLPPATVERLLLPMVSLAAGTLLGGAFFHMIPEGGASIEPLAASAWITGGFTVFLALEQFLHWHQRHGARAGAAPPVTYLILGGDAVHNFLGGLGIASTFLVDARAGAMAWIAAAVHEVPQELGDFGVLVHGGWPPRRALLWNVLSALTFPLGSLVAYVAARRVDVAGLVLFAAGSFIYIAASDLIPEIKSARSRGDALLHFGCFILGLSSMFAMARWVRAV
jgi:zinc and cadmium transporter